MSENVIEKELIINKNPKIGEISMESLLNKFKTKLLLSQKNDKPKKKIAIPQKVLLNNFLTENKATVSKNGFCFELENFTHNNFITLDIIDEKNSKIAAEFVWMLDKDNPQYIINSHRLVLGGDMGFMENNYDIEDEYSMGNDYRGNNIFGEIDQIIFNFCIKKNIRKMYFQTISLDNLVFALHNGYLLPKNKKDKTMIKNKLLDVIDQPSLNLERSVILTKEVNEK